MAQKYAGIFVPRFLLSVLRSELQGTDNVQGQNNISEHIFTPNGGNCVYYPSNHFRNAHSFENWEIFSDIPNLYIFNLTTLLFSVIAV